MSYTVIARRYRSQTFDDVVGQDAVAQTLKNAIKTDRVAHAYLFCGTRGVGKTTLARVLAKSLNCLKADGPTVSPCLECDSCVSVNAGDDIDVVEIDGASNRGIDNIRELIQNAIYRPARARFKIYIIDEVHMLTKEAFNALLKILEEPPEHVKFIFATTEPNKVLATIQSRCQRFDFQTIDANTIGTQLEMILKAENIGFEQDLIIHLSRLANGSMRDALSLLDQLISAGSQPLSAEQLNDLVGIPDSQKVMNLLTGIAGHDAAGVLEAIEQLVNTGQSSGQICDLLIQNMRDMMILMSAGPNSSVLVLTEEEKQQLQQIASQFDVPALIYNITTLEKLRWTLRTSETSRALLEASFLRLTLSEHFIGLDQLSTAGGTQTSRTPLKKKSIDSPPPRSVPPTAIPVTVPEILSVDFNVDAIRASWSQIAEHVKSTDSSLAGFLEQAHPVSVNNSTLTIQFDNSGQGQFAKSMCERKATLLQDVFSRLFSTPVNVLIQAGDSGASVPKKIQSAAADSTPRINRQERQTALNDPAVQMVLKGLNATPVEILKVQLEAEEFEETIENED